MWGTCLGFEHFVAYTAKERSEALGRFEAKNVSLPLEFLIPPNETRMFEDLGHKAYAFERNNMTFNFHQWGVAPSKFDSDPGLKAFWTPTSQSRTPNTGIPFVASMESKHYPIFGTQFHPEKTSELWSNFAIDHSWESISLQQHFSKMLVGMSRANTNSFGSWQDYQKYDISNYSIQ